MKKHEEKITAEKITRKVFELSWYDRQGYIDKHKILRFIFLGSVFIYTILMHLIMLIHSYAVLGFHVFKNQENMVTFEEQLMAWFLENIKDIKMATPEFIFINLSIFTLIIILSIKFIFYIRAKALLQSNLSSIGLNQFYLSKIDRETNTYTFTLIKGEKLEFDRFKDKSGNLKQIFGFENSLTKREGKNQIIVQFSEKFPTIQELSDLNVKDFQVVGKIFMGIGLPDIGSNVNKKDLIKGKFIPKYIEFDDLPQGIGNFGGAGFGKSNTLNMVFQSIFMNFDRVKNFTFIDFKQGIEAEPYRRLEQEKQTGRIFTLDDDRLKLLNYLEKLEIITKARGIYIKEKGLKKIKGKAVITFFDEMAEVLDYEPKEKEEKKVQNRTYELIESLLRIGRAAGIIIGYSTQSPLQHTSGLSTGMKNNTPLRMTHGLTSSSQVSSVYEDLKELGINPVEYDIGRVAVINTTNSTIFETRSLFVPDDFTNDIEFSEVKEDAFDIEIKEYYKKYVEQEKQRMQKMQIGQGDKLFSLDELLEDILNNKLVNDDLYQSKKDTEIPIDKPVSKAIKQDEKINFKSKAKEYREKKNHLEIDFI